MASSGGIEVFEIFCDLCKVNGKLIYQIFSHFFCIFISKPTCNNTYNANYAHNNQMIMQIIINNINNDNVQNS